MDLNYDLAVARQQQLRSLAATLRPTTAPTTAPRSPAAPLRAALAWARSLVMPRPTAPCPTC